MVNAKSVAIRSSRPMWIFMLAGLAVLSLAFVWRGAGRMMNMQTKAAGNAEFAQLKTEDDTKIVIEVTEIDAAGRIKGKLLEKQDETHYMRTATLVEVDRGRIR